MGQERSVGIRAGRSASDGSREPRRGGGCSFRTKCEPAAQHLAAVRGGEHAHRGGEGEPPRRREAPWTEEERSIAPSPMHETRCTAVKQPPRRSPIRKR